MTHSVALSEQLYRQLEQRARQHHRSVDEWVEETVKREMPAMIAVEEDLPPWLRSELRAMQDLSDEALWSLASSTMLLVDRAELAELNDEAGERPLTPTEADRQRVLLNVYNETILRRAHAALLLKVRGYDISNPAVLRPA